MLFSHTRGRSIVSLSSAETLGTVVACTVAPSPARIEGFRLKTRGRGGHVLAWENIHAFGNDAVTIRSMEKLQAEKDMEPGAPADKSHDPIGKPVLTETGVSRGMVEDIDFNEENGHIRRLLTAEAEIPGERLLGTGNYALIVTSPG